MSYSLVKPVVAAGVATALDKYWLQEPDMQSSLIFGASVGVGTYVGSMVGAAIAPSVDLPVLGNGKGLGQRVVEVVGGSGTSWLVHKYIFQNTNYNEDMMKTVGIVVAADVIGELVDDFMAGRPLAIFQ